MEAVTQVVDSTLLAGIIPLPKKFLNKKVEVTVTLDDDKKTDSKSHKQKIKIGFLKIYLRCRKAFLNRSRRKNCS